MRVRFTPSGRLQFLTVLAHVHGENPEAARKLRRLARFPKSGRLIPEFPELPYREIVVPPYRLFYRVDGKTVWVVAVWHGAQIPGEPVVK